MITFPHTLTLSVTEEHIQQGTPNNASYCPIALALKERFRHDLLTVDDSYAEIYDDWFTALYKLSKPAGRFVHRFDQGKPIRPATFRLQRFR